MSARTSPGSWNRRTLTLPLPLSVSLTLTLTLTLPERRFGVRNSGRAAVTLQSVRLVRGTTGFSASPDCKLPFKLAAGKGYAEIVVRVTPAQRGMVCDTLCAAAS